MRASLGQRHRLRERFEEGGVGDGLLWLVAAPGEDAKALRARKQRDLLRQPGLAYPGSPTRTSNRPCPLATASSAASITASSRSRPTSGPVGSAPRNPPMGRCGVPAIVASAPTAE